MARNKQKDVQTWQALTPRQQHYLQVLYVLDQEKETAQKERFHLDRIYTAIPAREWRAISSQELLPRLGKGPSGERWQDIITSLTASHLLEVEGECKQIWVTTVGRAVVRAGLQIEPVTKKLTDRQERYATSIAQAGLAPLEEVRAAFLDKQEGQARIEQWGNQLRNRQRAERQEQERQSILANTRYEPCAYPGCNEKIKLVPVAGWSSRHTPEPTMSIAVWSDTKGSRYTKDPETGEWTLQKNSVDVEEQHFYGCSLAHQEAIRRMRFHVSLVLDQEAEAYLTQFQYPIKTSLDARLTVSELAFQRALQLVEETSQPVMEKRAIRAEGRRQITLLLEQAEREERSLTDHLDTFRRLYLSSFCEGWEQALKHKGLLL